MGAVQTGNFETTKKPISTWRDSRRPRGRVDCYFLDTCIECIQNTVKTDILGYFWNKKAATKLE